MMQALVRFRTAQGEYAVRVEHAREVRSAEGIIPLPASRPGVAGLVRWEDEAISVLSTLGDEGQHVLILDAGDRPFGLLVDEVVTITRADPAEMGPPPEGQAEGLITGVINAPGGLVLVVDAVALGRRLGP